MRGYCLALLNHAKVNARHRLDKGRIAAGAFDLELPQVLDMLRNQEGRCAYSGIVMVLLPFTHWQCSLERIDQNKGYTRDNVVLIALEFQTFAQWTWHKVLSLPKLHQLGTCALEVQLKLDTAMVQINQADLVCLFRQLLRTARSSARHRHMKGHPHAGSFDLSLDDMVGMFAEQRGLCGISRVPLGIHGVSDWHASIERLDNDQGYVEGNCTLICREFQSTDYSRRSNFEGDIQGSAQWSVSKFVYLIDWLQELRVRNWILNQANVAS